MSEYGEGVAIDIIKQNIIESVFFLEIKRGHLKWSVNEIALKAKVSRSLVYYHFGKTKKDVLMGCLQTIVQEFYGLTPERRKMAKVSLAESLELTHAMYTRNVSYAIFYQKWRQQDSPIRDVYLECEKLYDAKLKTLFPKATEAQRNAIQGLFHGIVTAPYVDREAIDAAVALLRLNELKDPPSSD